MVSGITIQIVRRMFLFRVLFYICVCSDDFLKIGSSCSWCVVTKQVCAIAVLIS